MQQPSRTAYVSVHVTRAAHRSLQRRTLAMTSPAQRRLTMSEVLEAAMILAERDPAQLLAILREREH